MASCGAGEVVASCSSESVGIVFIAAGPEGGGSGSGSGSGGGAAGRPPRMDGLVLCRLLRQEVPYHRQPRVVLVAPEVRRCRLNTSG